MKESITVRRERHVREVAVAAERNFWTMRLRALSDQWRADANAHNLAAQAASKPETLRLMHAAARDFTTARRADVDALIAELEA